MGTNDFAKAVLDKATVVHLQPDDVLVLSNLGDIDPEQLNLDVLERALGGRTLVLFHGPIHLGQLRDLDGGCACCGHKTTEGNHG